MKFFVTKSLCTPMIPKYQFLQMELGQSAT